MKRIGSFLLPALALLWLALIYAATAFGTKYTVPVTFTQRINEDCGYLSRSVRIVSASPAAQRLGAKPGTRLDLGVLSWAQCEKLGEGTAQGEPLALPLVIGDRTHTIALPATAPDFNGSPFENGLSLVVLTLSLMLAGYLGYRKPGIMALALILFVGGAGLNWPELAVLLSRLPDTLYELILIPFSVLCGDWPTLVLASFAIRLPGDAVEPRKRTAVSIIDALVLAGFLFELFVPSTPALTYVTSLSFAVILVVATSLSLHYAKRADRSRVLIVFVAVMIGGAAYALVIMALIAFGAFSNFYTYVNLSIVLVPAAVTYAVLRHRVFDITFALNRAVVYAVTSVLVLLVVAALEWLVERYFTSLTKVEGQAVEFGIALAVIVAARLLHSRVDRTVDNVFFRERHEQESALRRFATTAQFYTEQQPLIGDALDKLETYARVRGAAAYLADGPVLFRTASTFATAAPSVTENDAAWVELRAHREELDLQNVRTALPGVRLYPMILAGRLIGVICTGERESGELMPPDIDDAVQRVVAAVAIALAAIESDRIRRELAALRPSLA